MDGFEAAAYDRWRLQTPEQANDTEDLREAADATCHHQWHNGGTVYVTATGLSYDDIYCQLCGATAAPVFQDGRVVGYLKSIQ